MSVINHEFKHIHIHVPKTGGTSMHRSPWVKGRGHQTARHLIPQEPDYFSWGFTRSPYTRTLSTYSAALQHGTRWPQMFKGEKPVTFEEYVLSLPDKWSVRPHALPMAQFLCDREGKVLVDFVGQFEHIERDWEYVSRRVTGKHHQLGHANKSEHKTIEEMYTAEMIGVVNDVYSVDFDIFGYHTIIPFNPCREIRDE